MNLNGNHTPRKLSPRKPNNSFNGINGSSSSNQQSSRHRLTQIVIFFGLLLTILQFVYNAHSDSAKEETLDRMRLLGQGDVHNSESQQQQQKQMDEVMADVGKLRKQLDGKNKRNQEEMESLKTELTELKEQIVAQSQQAKKDTAEKEGHKGNAQEKNDKEFHAELQQELGAVKRQLDEYKEKGLGQDTTDSTAKEQARMHAETAKELQSLKEQLEDLKAEKIAAASTALDVPNTQTEKRKEATEAVVTEIEKNETSETKSTTEVEYPYAKPQVAKEFKKQKGVVIATKIHGSHQMPILRQFLCLFNFAYNAKMKYDVLVYTTESLSKEEEKEIMELGKPAKVTIVVDNPGLHELIDKLPENKKERFLRKCELDNDPDGMKMKNLTWFSNCKENGRSSRLAYNWQAEFRAWRIWTHASLKPYKYMLWIDADAFCTEEWKRDPVGFFIEHKLAIFFANHGAGQSPGGYPEFIERFKEAFNRTISEVEVVEGHLTSKNGTGTVSQIHGFMHMTDLDFFRSKEVLNWARILIGDEFLSRRFDDQLAVTAPAVVLAPERSWEMRANGVKLNVFHNGLLDGQEKAPAFNFRAFWNDRGGSDLMPGAKETCDVTANG